MNKQTIPIFFSIDNNYAPFLRVALKSMMMNSNNNYNYSINILHTDLRDDIKNSISEMLIENYTCNFIDMSEKIEYIK